MSDVPTRRRATLALGLLAPVPTLAVLATGVWWPGPVGSTLFVAAKLWVVALPAWWYLGVERGAWSWSPLRRGGLGLALASGVVLATAIGAVYAWLGDQLLDPGELRRLVAANGLGRPAVYLAGAAFWITLNSLAEEVVFRWFCYREARAWLPPWGAVLAAAAIFTAHHVLVLAVQFDGPIVWLGGVGVFAASCVWSALYARTGSIWPSYVSHAIVDVPLFVIGYFLLFSQ